MRQQGLTAQEQFHTEQFFRFTSQLKVLRAPQVKHVRNSLTHIRCLILKCFRQKSSETPTHVIVVCFASEVKT